MGMNDLLGIPRGTLKAIRVVQAGTGSAGSVGVSVRQFGTVDFNYGNITYIHDTVAGDSIIIPEDGLYFSCYVDRPGTGTAAGAGIQINTTDRTSVVPAASKNLFVFATNVAQTSETFCLSNIKFLKANDILTCHVSALSSPSTDPNNVQWTVVKLV